MATILTSRDINDYMDNLVWELKQWNTATEANGGAENHFGPTGSERIWGYRPKEYAQAIPSSGEPIIICSFAGWGGAIVDRNANKSGKNHRYLGRFRSIILLIWAATDRDVTLEQSREHASRLWKWLDEHNLNGWSDLTYTEGGAPLVPEDTFDVMNQGKAGYRILHYCERDLGRTIKYVAES